MEKRILLAFTLSFIVFVVYMRMFAPQPEDIPVQYPDTPQATEPMGRETAEALPESRPKAPTLQPAPETEQPVVEEEVRQASAEQTIVVETPLYQARFTNRGARLQSFVLAEYTDGAGLPFEMVPQEASQVLDRYPFDVDLESVETNTRVKKALFEASRPRITVREGDSEELTFTWADGRGLVVTKTLRFYGGSYVLDLRVSAKLAGNEIRKKVLYGPGIGEESRTGTYAQPDKGVIKAGQELRFYDGGDIEDGEGASVDVAAVGVSAHYFTGLMVPEPGSGFGARFTKESLEPQNGDGKKRDYITAALDVPGVDASFQAFVGPKEHDRLARLAPGMERVIDYGDWMGVLARPLRSALLWIHGFVGNYGWSIVLLTILINIALIPLKHHSYKSMRKMQKLAPQIKRINDRYKKLKPTDPKQQDKNREVMALYKENNVSPMSGCLPMLLMIPFFFAFYRLLMVSIELRHAPFMLWIQDLSTYDPYFVLPIAMGVTQLAVQKMSPQTSADPMQQKIMMMMPIMFVFILAWAPSGLVLYWFVNNLVSIGQQTLTNRILDEKAAHEEPKQAGGKSRKKKKKITDGS
jgi:YidC/Oxa1 family membrane protein insertase